MSDEKAPDAKTMREEINALFGVRWDTFVEWVVIAWLSIWFWTSRPKEHRTGSFLEWTNGPLAAVEKFLRSLDIGPPAWLTGTADWLIDAPRERLSTVLVVIAVVSCVTAVRNYRYSGLRTLALLAVALVCEVQGSFWPVLWVLLLAAIPAAWAWTLAFADGRRKVSQFSEDEYYFGERIVLIYFRRIVLLFLVPLFAPILLAGQLVVSFRTNVPYNAVKELNHEVIDALESHGTDRAEDLDALTGAAASAALQLAGNRSREAHLIAEAYRSTLKRRREAEQVMVAETPPRRWPAVVIPPRTKPD